MKAEISFCARDMAMVRDLVARYGLEPYPGAGRFDCDWQTRTIMRKSVGQL